MLYVTLAKYNKNIFFLIFESFAMYTEFKLPCSWLLYSRLSIFQCILTRRTNLTNISLSLSLSLSLSFSCLCYISRSHPYQLWQYKLISLSSISVLLIPFPKYHSSNILYGSLHRAFTCYHCCVNLLCTIFRSQEGIEHGEENIAFSGGQFDFFTLCSKWKRSYNVHLWKALCFLCFSLWPDSAGVST